jgi:hypothetical protein
MRYGLTSVFKCDIPHSKAFLPLFSNAIYHTVRLSQENVEALYQIAGLVNKTTRN